MEPAVPPRPHAATGRRAAPRAPRTWRRGAGRPAPRPAPARRGSPSRRWRRPGGRGRAAVRSQCRPGGRAASAAPAGPAARPGPAGRSRQPRPGRARWRPAARSPPPPRWRTGAERRRAWAPATDSARRVIGRDPGLDPGSHHRLAQLSASRARRRPGGRRLRRLGRGSGRRSDPPGAAGRGTARSRPPPPGRRQRPGRRRLPAWPLGAAGRGWRGRRARRRPGRRCRRARRAGSLGHLGEPLGEAVGGHGGDLHAGGGQPGGDLAVVPGVALVGEGGQAEQPDA